MSKISEGGTPKLPDFKAMSDEDLLCEFGEQFNYHEYVTTSEAGKFSEACLAAAREEILARMKARSS